MGDGSHGLREGVGEAGTRRDGTKMQVGGL